MEFFLLLCGLNQLKGTRLMDELLDQSEAIQPKFAGFWVRFIAFMIDSILLSIFGILIGIQMDHNVFLGITAAQLVKLFYDAWMESGPKQGTFGKQFMHIKVVDDHGRRLTFSKAFIRSGGKILSEIIFLIGYLMAAFDAHKQSLHDKLARTFVVKD
ncbi:MAG: RDD family protein [Chitinophagales bacterium]|nr:RDD family protein [Chitinophagales bacterium]